MYEASLRGFTPSIMQSAYTNKILSQTVTDHNPSMYICENEERARQISQNLIKASKSIENIEQSYKQQLEIERAEYSKKEKLMNNKIAQLQKLINSQKSNYPQNGTQSMARLNDIIQKLTEEKNTLKSKLCSLYKIYCASTKQIETLQEEKHSQKHNVELNIEKEKKASDEGYTKRITKLEDENIKLNDEKNNLESEIAQLKKQIHTKNKEVDSLNTSLEEAEKSIREMKKQHSILEAQLDEAKTKCSITSKKKDTIEQEMEDTTAENKKLKSNVKSLENQCATLTEKLEAEKQLINEKVRHISELEISLKKQESGEKEEIRSKKAYSDKKQLKLQEEPQEQEKNKFNGGGGDGSTPESEIDINDENVPMIVEQLLSKEELQSKSLQEIFKIRKDNKEYTYKDVLKCMAALSFKQKYSAVLKSVFSIWLNAAVEKQKMEIQNEDENEEHQNKEEEQNSKSQEENIDYESKEEHDSKEEINNKLDNESHSSNKKKQSNEKKEKYDFKDDPESSHSRSEHNDPNIDNREDSYKPITVIPDEPISHKKELLRAKDNSPDKSKHSDKKEGEKIDKSKQLKNDEKLILEDNQDTPNLEDIVIMWTLMIFSHSLEVAQAQNR